MEYHDTSRRGRLLIILGVILALAAGGAAFFLLNQAQPPSEAEVQRVPVVVATRVIPARKPIEPGDVTVRQVPVDQTNATGVVDSIDLVIGKVPAVTVLQGQMVTTNLLTSTTSGAAFSILDPTETVGPDSEAWRAVSMTVPPDRAVGGFLEVGQTVDVFVTAQVNVPQELAAEGRYYTDRSTKITYQDMQILARSADQYVVRASLVVAEEISHLLATGSVQFSMALRPEIDVRLIDASLLGATTNRIITKYGIPVPEVYPAGGQPGATLPPLPNPTPFVPQAFPTPTAEPTPTGSAR
jgi:Flp pilus assembly protein CpaB